MEKGIGDHDCQMIVWKKWRVAHVGKGFEMSGSNCLVPRDIWKAQKWPLWATAVALIPNSVYHYLPLIHRLNYIGVITKFVDLCQVSQVIPWYAVAKWKKGVGWWPWLSDDFVKKWRVAHVGKGLEMSSCGYNCLVPWDILKGSKVTIPTHSSCTYSTLQPSITLAELLLSIALWF